MPLYNSIFTAIDAQLTPKLIINEILERIDGLSKKSVLNILFLLGDMEAIYPDFFKNHSHLLLEPLCAKNYTSISLFTSGVFAYILPVNKKEGIFEALVNFLFVHIDHSKQDNVHYRLVLWVLRHHCQKEYFKPLIQSCINHLEMGQNPPFYHSLERHEHHVYISYNQLCDVTERILENLSDNMQLSSIIYPKAIFNLIKNKYHPLLAQYLLSMDEIQEAFKIKGQIPFVIDSLLGQNPPAVAPEFERILTNSTRSFITDWCGERAQVLLSGIAVLQAREPAYCDDDYHNTLEALLTHLVNQENSCPAAEAFEEEDRVSAAFCP